MNLDPDDLDIKSRYKLLVGGIVPRPIALVSTVSPAGEPNLAPFSFFTGAGSNPMTLLFCPVNLPGGGEKDTLRNAKPVAEGGTGEFVVNAAVEAYAREMAAAAEPLGYGDSEFELTGLHLAPSLDIRPPRVAESPLSFECRTLEVVRTNPGASGGGNVVIGRVVRIHLADDLVNERLHVDPDRLQAIGRMGGLGYSTTRDRFDLPRGRGALEAPDPLPRSR